jgi:hypothetical protein
MSDLAELILVEAHDFFLGDEDLILMRQAADEVDATYGESLDPLVPAVLTRLTQSSRAA